MVRAGEGGSLYGLNQEQSTAAIGWAALGDYSQIMDEDSLRQALAEAYPEHSANKRSSSFGQLRAFLMSIAVGDLVVTPAPGGSPIAVGEVTGPPVYRPDAPDDARCARQVKWLGTIERGALGPDLRGSVGSISTVFEIARSNVTQRLRAMLRGEPDTPPPAPAPAPAVRISQARTYEQLFALASVLAQYADAIPSGQAVDETKALLPPTDEELTLNNSNQELYSINIAWWSVELTKIGWLSKGPVGGQWSLTDVGRGALAEFDEAQAFGTKMHAEYKQLIAEQKAQAEKHRSEAAAARLISRIPPGRWSTFGDVGELTGSDATSIGQLVWNIEVPGSHRILRADGTISADAYPGSAAKAIEERLMLEQEGIQVDPHAPAHLRMSPQELQELLTDPAAHRAWLVKGSSVAGTNMVPIWLDGNYVSVPAVGISPITSPVERAAVVKAIEATSVGRASDYRRRKVEEYDRFLRLMQADDLVITTWNGNLYAGRILGDTQWVTDETLPARARRKVSWVRTEGINYSTLPSPIPERLQTAEDVADFTDIFDMIDGLVSAETEDAPPVVVEDLVAEPLRLRLPNKQLADRLFLPAKWLEDVVHDLQRRNQIIFYGPPGTGKTYVALELAEYLADPGNVRIVQFHPSYAYEDFIAGFRPKLTDAGQATFELRQGPLMQIADQARDDPSTPYILIIDEINRANLAKVFGELYFLLEYRKRTVETLYSEEGANKFSLPENLFIIGTMNTADRSIALVDAAMRRRFGFVPLHPDEPHVAGMLAAWQAKNHPDSELDAAALLRHLNELLASRDYAIGPSYFMKPWIYESRAGLAQMWKSDIIPLLEEHHAGEDLDVASHYGLGKLLKLISADSGLAAQPADGDESDVSDPAVGLD